MLAILLILIAGTMAVAKAHGVNFDMERLPMFDVGVMIAKATGATLGSGIAVVFEPAHDSIPMLFKRFVLGTIMGVVFAPRFLDLMRWEPRLDNWVAAATTCGLIGYIILQILYSPEIREAVKNRIKAKAKG